MITNTPSAEILVYGADSSVSRFLLCDTQMLNSINQNRIFDQREIVLTSAQSVTVYPCAAVTRIDLVMDGFPTWAFPQNVRDIVEITWEEFGERFTPSYAGVPWLHKPDGSRYVFGEVELTDGQRLFREVHLQPLPPKAELEILPHDSRFLLRRLLSTHTLFCRRQGGGAILINPRHITRMNFYPGPVIRPANAWKVQATTPVDSLI